MEDRRMACIFGKVRGSAWKPVEGILARQSSWDEADVCASNWNHMEVPRSERRSLEASAERLLEVSAEVSTPIENGSILLLPSKLPSLSRKLPSLPHASITQRSEFHCRWERPRKRCKLLEASMEAKQAPMEVVEASNKTSRGSFRGSFHGSAHFLPRKGLPREIPMKQWKRLKIPWKQWKLPDTA